MNNGRRAGAGRRYWRTAALLAAVMAPLSAGAVERIEFRVPGASGALVDTIRAASLLSTAEGRRTQDPQELMAAARADYARILGALYSEGYYSGVIHILIDGREAAYIPALSPPAAIRNITVSVETGRPFRFERTGLGPLVAETELPEGFRKGERAHSFVITDSVSAATDAWRQAGHAKVRVAQEAITADHPRAEIDTDIRLDPGPRVRFGRLHIAGNEKVRTARVHKIAGLPEGEVFDPDALAESARRLRRTGTFSSVALTEAERLGPGNTLDITATVVEAPRRRLSFGAEISSDEGLALTGYWLHRNLLGGAEQFRVDGAITGIGGETGGVDYSLGATYSRPATITPDTKLNIGTLLEHKEERTYTTDSFTFGVGLEHYFSEQLTASIGVSYGFFRTEEAGSTRNFQVLMLPVGATWDLRDERLNPHSGYYLSSEVAPFLGLADTSSGAKLKGDARAYFAPGGKDGRIVFAGRAQVGMVMGVALADTPRDFLFYSGGGGTVRGQPYQSLGLLNTGAVGADPDKGGLSFAGLSAEIRHDTTKRIGLVAFFDAGIVTGEDFFGGNTGWHSGAGIGVRYNTGIGPIRLDVAAPVHGDTGSGVQIYVGIGQAF